MVDKIAELQNCIEDITLTEEEQQKRKKMRELKKKQLEDE